MSAKNTLLLLTKSYKSQYADNIILSNEFVIYFTVYSTLAEVLEQIEANSVEASPSDIVLEPPIDTGGVTDQDGDKSDEEYTGSGNHLGRQLLNTMQLRRRGPRGLHHPASSHTDRSSNTAAS